MTHRLVVFLVVFVAMSLAFVPLLSLYGLRVCPVLSIPGFGFGCYYTSAFIVLTNLTNVGVILLARHGERRYLPGFFRRRRNRSWIYAGSYLLATITALLLLQVLLRANHLTAHSRAPEILVLASFLLGITQVYGLNWALADADGEQDEVEQVGFQKRWLSHVARTMLPVAIVGTVLLHFLIRQAESFNNGKIAPLVSHDTFIEQTSYVIYFLTAWLILTFTFHFLSERDHVARVQGHLDRLHDLDFNFRSRLGEAWGLWAAILDQLNAFSKALGERTRLLNNFSRFVTGRVAEQALHQELTETTGINRELTVIMTDIRNFTSISESLSPNEVVTLLNQYFSAMLDVITNFQISVDKFIGDGILAYVECETNGDEDAATMENRLGVDAALAMIERVEELNWKLRKMNLPAIRIGVGIFRGPLVIGLIGSEAKLEHTIIGDTVNRTARLESLSKELRVSIVISDRVWRSLEDEVRGRFKSFGKQTMKGIAEPIEVFGGPTK
ncbi:MAG: adenylate/guanylate cyclase domain-containing protein [Methylocystis sp.]